LIFIEPDGSPRTTRSAVGTLTGAPPSWSDQLDTFLNDYRLERLSGIGHYTNS
jgi:hypothetical protein